MPKNNFQQDLRATGLVFFIGFLVIASTGVGYLIGDWLDKAFNTAPYLVIVLVGLGCASGFYQAYKIGRRFFRQ